VVALEHFESMNESFSKHNIYMTIALSALVALLAASMIRISTKNWIEVYTRFIVYYAMEDLFS